jgi:hypothetical protein
MTYQQNDSYDALIDAIYDGYRYEPSALYESENDAKLAAVFDSHMSNATVSYIDLMPAVAYDVCAYRLAKFGDDERDPYGQRLLDWFGQLFADLVAFDLNENFA